MGKCDSFVAFKENSYYAQNGVNGSLEVQNQHFLTFLLRGINRIKKWVKWLAVGFEGKLLVHSKWGKWVKCYCRSSFPHNLRSVEEVTSVVNLWNQLSRLQKIIENKFKYPLKLFLSHYFLYLNDFDTDAA